MFNSPKLPCGVCLLLGSDAHGNKIGDRAKVLKERGPTVLSVTLGPGRKCNPHTDSKLRSGLLSSFQTSNVPKLQIW